MGTYKTNWQLNETVMPEDCNRIETNIKENNKNYDDLKNEYEQNLKDINKKIESKPERGNVLLKVPYPSDRDCNSFKSLNTFFSFDTSIGSFKNTPEGNLEQSSSKIFIVTNRGHSLSRIQQEWIQIYPQNKVTKYTRNLICGEWGNWYKNYDESNKPTWNDIKDKPDLYTKIESDDRYQLSDLGTVTDFNNCKTNPGTWLVNSGASVPNAPYEGGIWGTLEVLNSTVKGDFIQRFTNVAGEVFSRYYHTSTKTWDSWTDNNKKFMRTNVSEVEDFNTCLNAGVYLVGSYTTLPNAPYNDSTGIYGTLEVFDRRSEYIQRFTDSSSRVFIRFKNYKGKWTSWVYQTNINDFEGKNGQSHGYQVLPSGIIIQWGSTIIPFDGHRAHGYLYYPIAFKEYVHCCGNVASNDYGGFCETSGTVVGDSLTRGYAEALDIGNGNMQGHNVRFQWIAIGK